MHDSSHKEGARRDSDCPQPETSAGQGAHARVQSYLDEAAASEDGLEAMLKIFTGKLAEHLLALEDDLEAVRGSESDATERLAVGIEATEAVYKTSKAAHDQSDLLLRLRRHREKAKAISSGKAPASPKGRSFTKRRHAK